jgi:integrase/recombinase XerD
MLPSLLPGDVLVPAGRTLSELAPVFIRDFSVLRRKADNTCRSYATALAAFLSFCAQANLVYPDDVRTKHIELFQAVLLEQRGLQPSTVNLRRYALRAFWEWMNHEEITERNPAARAYPIKQPKRLPRYLPVPEQDRLLRALSRDHSPAGVRDYALHATLCFGGLRCAELSTLRLIDLDLETGVLRVVGKGDKERPVPIVDPLASVLTRYLSDARPALLAGRVSPYVFVRVGTWGWKHDGQPLERRSIFRIVRKTLRRVLGIENGHPHMLRHSFASRVREHGGSIQDLQEVMAIPTSPRPPGMPTS